MELSTVLFHLIRCELLGETPEQYIVDSIDDSTLQKLYKISKTHDIATIVWNSLAKLNVASQEVKDKFVKQQMLAVYRYERSKYELKQISEFLNENKIEFIALKGSVLRDYYPEPWMRTSCDIDILVHEEDIEKAKDLLIQKMEYKFLVRGSHDIEFMSPSDIRVELHYSLIEDDIALKADIPLNKVWEFTTPAEEYPMMRKISNEMFYYYHIAHMVKHFLSGGCGIRPFIDLFIMNQQFAFDKDKKKELLVQGGLLKFASEIENLTEIWFNGKSHTELSQKMEYYLLSGGLYGTVQNKVAVQQTQKGGKFQYVWSRIWLSFDKLKFQYPILNKHKWLFPFCQICRWFRMIFCGKVKRSTTELKINSRVSNDKATLIQDILTQLEL